MFSPLELSEKKAAQEQEVLAAYAVKLFDALEEAQKVMEPFDTIAAFKLVVNVDIEDEHTAIFSKRSAKTPSPLQNLKDQLNDMLKPFDMVSTQLVRSTSKGTVDENNISSGEIDPKYFFVCHVGAILPKETVVIRSAESTVTTTKKAPVFTLSDVGQKPDGEAVVAVETEDKTATIEEI